MSKICVKKKLHSKMLFTAPLSSSFIGKIHAIQLVSIKPTLKSNNSCVNLLSSAVSVDNLSCNVVISLKRKQKQSLTFHKTLTRNNHQSPI